MAGHHPPYPPEFRQQIIELVRIGYTPAELAREFRAAGRVTDRVAQSLPRVSRVHSGIEFVQCLNHGEVDEVVEELYAELRRHGHRGDACHRDDHR